MRTAVLAAVLSLMSGPSWATGIIRRAIGGMQARRVVWRGDGRLHIATGGLAGPASEPFTRALERRLARHRAVSWAAVNAPLGVIIVACSHDVPDAELAGIVENVEREHNVPAPKPEDRPGPVDRVPAQVAALAASVAGLTFAGAGRALRTVRLPAELGSLVQIIDTQPRLRAVVERAAGPGRADLVLAAANTLAQSAAHGVSVLALDISQRTLQLAEAVAQREARRRNERKLFGNAHKAAAPPTTTARPSPLPPGKVERYSERIGLGAAAGFGGVLAASGNPRRAAAVALAGLPKAPRLGREGFAAALGCLLSGRGLVIMDHRVLRLLDRIDTIVIDQDVLVTDRPAVTDIAPVADHASGELALIMHALFDPEQADATRTDGTFTLGPLDALAVSARAGASRAAALRRAGVRHILGLAQGTRLKAVIGLGPEPARAADLLVTAADQAGTTLLLADRGETPRDRSPDELPGGRRLAESIRRLQAEGARVLLVSRNRQALAAADCAIGVNTADGRPAWGAHLLAGDDLAAAALVIEAVAAARSVCDRSIALSQAGTALGVGLAFGGNASQATSRSLLAVNSAAAIAFTSGAWTAADLARKQKAVPLVSHVPWHAMPAGLALDRLASRPGGLSTNEAQRRWHPPDDRQQPPSLSRAILADLANPLTPILAGGAVLSASIGAVTDAAIITGVSALSALMGGVQRISTDRSMARLFAASAVTARVLRGGAEHTIPATSLVTGDIVVLGAGDVVPADCRLIETAALQVDESSLTGEWYPVGKTTEPVIAAAVADRNSMLYEGTTVAAGRATAVVAATGSATQMGQSLAALPGAAPVTGVEARLAQITRTTLPLALGSAGAVVAAGLLRGRPARDTAGAAVGLAVASVPEGLPFLVTAAQLAAARRLAARGALVRHPRTIEALGRVNVLCFDKTGTLTAGQMAIAAISDGTASRPVNTLGRSHRQVLAAALRATPSADGDGKVEHMTDEAVLLSAAAAGVGRSDGHREWRQSDAVPFEPNRGYHATLAGTASGPVLSIKGAPELILPRCTRWRGRVLGAGGKKRLRAELDRLTGQGYRVLAVAENPVADGHRLNADLRELSFAGFLAFGDPVRATAGASVRELREAGVHIVMITGDHPATAKAIATELEVLNGGTIVTGTDLDRLDDDALAATLAGASVIARCTPAHKVRVVRAYQAAGRVVAMTGDGANDAAAIRLADVGIALGKRGTPAAREAADLVVSDDRLETIISAVVEGRAMWRSVRQAIGILVGGNIGEIGYTLFGTLLTGISPLTARQLLLVNLLTDLAPALAIALRSPPEDASPGLLAEGPDASLGAALTDEIAVRAVATGAAASGAWLAARLTGRAARARTVGLAAVVGTELGQTLLIGGRSPAVVAASLVSTGVLVGIVQTPGVSQFFGCTPLGPVGWSIAGGSTVAGSVGSLLLPRLGRSVMPTVRSLASSAAAGRAGQLVAELRGQAGSAAPGEAGAARRRSRPLTARHPRS